MKEKLNAFRAKTTFEFKGNELIALATYSTIGPIVMSILSKVTKPRGLGNDKTVNFFTALCPNCLDRKNNRKIDQAATLLEMTSIGAGAFPDFEVEKCCANCGDEWIAFIIHHITEKEKNEILNSSFISHTKGVGLLQEVKTKSTQQRKKACCKRCGREIFAKRNNELCSICTVASGKHLDVLRQPNTSKPTLTERIKCKNISCNREILKNTAQRYSGKCKRCFDKNKNCFIATAAYGDIDHPKVELFRVYRDEILEKSILGKKLVSIYYILSPRLGRIVEQHLTLRLLSQKLLNRLALIIARRLN